MTDRPGRALILARGSSPSLRKHRQVLDRIEQGLPEGGDLQIWSELEIFDSSGRVDEIDAVALGHYGLYVLAIRSLEGAAVSPAHELARRLEVFFAQELGPGRLRVEPLALCPDEDARTVIPEPTRRHMVTVDELLRALGSGELPGDPDPPDRVPLDAATAAAIAEILGGLRRMVRPGRGSRQQELALLQRDIVADLMNTHARSSEPTAWSAGEQGGLLRYRIEEAAAAWVIACVFVGVLEDRDLIERRSAGDGVDLIHLLSTVGQYRACESILGQSNRCLWEMPPSEEGAAALRSFFGRGSDRGLDLYKGEALWGELYQGISEPLRKANASVQTPAIVEEFLLDRVLEPACEALDDSAVSVIDPACGSGTLLVGAFQRLLGTYPLSPGEERAAAALDRVHGVDLSPAATMITRIRLLLEYISVTGSTCLAEVPALPLHVETEDSLLSSSEILERRYTVVVCSPPLNVAGDPARREAYHDRYRSAAGRFPLFAPFIERCFQLAEQDGFVGLLVGNSFMKRKFGRALVEEVLPAIDLTHVIDTAGAYVPGYGTPTVMLLGRNRSPRSAVVRVVVGKRGEPIAPIDPREGRVWKSIVRHLDRPGHEDDYIAVRDVPREQLARHPWALATPEASLVQETLERGGVRLDQRAASVHRGVASGLDPVYMLPRRTGERFGIEPEVLWPLLRGADIRDFSCSSEDVALLPITHGPPSSTASPPRWWAWLWRFRPVLVNRSSFGAASAVPWWLWLQAPRDLVPRVRIVGPAVARGNHFALVRGGVVASASVLVIEPDGATSEDELYAWLAFLNSSTAAFWMKQVAFSKGTAGTGIRPQEPVYDLSGALPRVPIPRGILEPGSLRDELVALAKQLERTARELAAAAPEQVIGRWDRSSREALVESLADAQLRERTLSRRMVCEQEDLDWLVYEGVGLTTSEPPIPKASASPEQRPFAWLTDAPPSGLDRRLTDSWRRRRKAGQTNDALKVLESAPYKRTFRSLEDDRADDLGADRDELELDSARSSHERHGILDYRRRTALACERWLLDAIEALFRGMPPRAISAQDLASRAAIMPGVPAVVAMLAEKRGERSALVLERYVAKLVSGHAVPYLAALRHTEPGLEKRARWEAVWASQHRQAAGAAVDPIPALPYYGRTDYRDASTFRHRGRLDVPNERFIAYPDERDAAPLYGWAGWTPVQRAEVLMGLMEQHRDVDRAADYLAPLLAGILELVSWMPSWDGEVPELGSAAETFLLRVQNEAGRLKLNIEALRVWRPSGRDRPA